VTFSAGKELGHYKIVRKLGTGGMADVYEAQDLKLGRTVALKILPPELMRNPEMVARFQTEVRAAASLNHRSIVTVFEVGAQDGVHFYSMRLLTGGDLRRRIRAGGLRAIDALAILRELCGAFEHAHGRGFVHRDVKPENVMFDDEGLPVLTDFGIAKALGSGSNMTGTGVAIGTPRYFSPEQARGKPVDARSDLYSLGIILHEMLTGKPPYDGEDALAIVMKHVNDPIPVLPGEHAHLQALLEQLMAKDPAHRVASAKELRKQIAGVGGFASLTPQPINLGEESELVQRLLSGEGAAYTPAPMNPTSGPGAPAAPSDIGSRPTQLVNHPRGSFGRAGEARPVADDGGQAAAVKSPPPRKAPVEQIIPYRSRLAVPQSQPSAPEAPAGKGLSLKPLVAASLLVVAGLLWLGIWLEETAHSARQAPVPAPLAAPAPAPASSAADAAPAVVTPAPVPAPQAAPARVQESVPAAQPKPVPKPAPEPQKAVAPAAEPVPQVAAPKPEPKPEPQPTVVPAPAPVEQPAAAKPQPSPVPAPAPAAASAEPAAPAGAEPEASTDEDDFLRQRAEQLKLERERREAARKKAAEEALRQPQPPPEPPAEGESTEPTEPPPPQ
jgi:serine/threonine protein kinase